MKNVKYVPHTLALLVALSLPLQAVAVELADVPQNHWARAAVTEATGSRQLMSGMKDGS
ncbi:MAG: hypothetical protein H7338_25200, partial [Candidatus Sericytochromatia bacterium]|nr:hypothetical protein [Candidatus Sericytochromatia bacterium]